VLDVPHLPPYTCGIDLGASMRSFSFVNLGLIGYSECLLIQQQLVKRRLEGSIGDILLLLEHRPVITMGTAGGEDSLLASPDFIKQAGIEIRKTDRGGNITYHGPGQLVGYPIFDLRSHGKDVHAFLRNLERVIVGVLSDFGVTGKTLPGYTGVWVNEYKICSIGIAVRRWISYHGFALNVDPILDHWQFIHPCGLVGKQVTSLKHILGYSPSMDAVKASVVDGIAKVFDMDAVALDADSITSV